MIEAIGYDKKLTRALYKALQSSGMHVVNYGTIFVTIADKDKEEALPLIRRFYNLGFNIQATAGTGEFLKNKNRNNIQLIVTTHESRLLNFDLLKKMQLDVPPVTELAALLHKEDKHIAADIMTIEEMVRELCP